ncbi:MAG TPA: hypothetical protein PLQ36_00955 [Candidatus Gracilibacteria bacterium]|nr:hypothetical protein [Candidatus Gracilibacteria bacterium]
MSDFSKSEKELAALSYLPVLSLLIYFSPEAKKSQFIEHHARQGVLLFVIELILYILSTWISWLEYFNFILLVAMVMGIIEAANGNLSSLPLVHTIVNFSLWQNIADYLSKLKHKAFAPKKEEINKNVNFVQLNKQISQANVSKAESNLQANLAELIQYLRGETRSQWSELMQEMFKNLEIYLESKALKFEKYAQGLLVQQEDKICVIGKIQQNSLVLAYLSQQVFLPPDEQWKNWSLKNYTLADEHKIRALFHLLFN